MKKIIVIVAVAVVVLLVVTGIFSRFMVNQSMDNASLVARNSALRSTTSMIIPYIELWSAQNNGSYTGFIDNPDNLSKIQPIISDLEARLKVKIRYYISSTQRNFVIRLGVEGETLYYCSDSKGIGAAEFTESTTGQFTAKTNCSGQPL